jgi:hypothetical protein
MILDEIAQLCDVLAERAKEPDPEVAEAAAVAAIRAELEEVREEGRRDGGADIKAQILAKLEATTIWQTSIWNLVRAFDKVAQRVGVPSWADPDEVVQATIAQTQHSLAAAGYRAKLAEADTEIERLTDEVNRNAARARQAERQLENLAAAASADRSELAIWRASGALVDACFRDVAMPDACFRDVAMPDDAAVIADEIRELRRIVSAVRDALDARDPIPF